MAVFGRPNVSQTKLKEEVIAFRSSITGRKGSILQNGNALFSLFMNNACNFCDDVVAETADISFGDAWVEPYSSDGKGTNAIITRSPVIDQIIRSGAMTSELHLENVSAELIERTQAAGLRMRREGLSFRLTWNNPGIVPKKRVVPGSVNITEERKRIYKLRNSISKWSHRVFRISRITGLTFIYLLWARTATAVYHGFAYHQGELSAMIKRFAVMKRG